MSAHDAAPKEQPKARSNAVREAPAGPSDEELLARMRRGEQAAFRWLMDRYQRRVYKLALSIVKDHEDAMDVSQEAFLRVHQNLGSFKGDARLSTWIHRITYNLSIDLIRRAGRKGKVAVEDTTLTDEGAEYEPWGEQSQSPQKSVLRGELGAQLQRALDALSENHRAIIVLREVNGLSYEEIAETLEIPKGTVMSRLFHARQRMQAMLKGYLHADDGPDAADPDAGEDERPQARARE